MNDSQVDWVGFELERGPDATAVTVISVDATGHLERVALIDRVKSLHKFPKVVFSTLDVTQAVGNVSSAAKPEELLLLLRAVSGLASQGRLFDCLVVTLSLRKTGQLQFV